MDRSVEVTNIHWKDHQEDFPPTKVKVQLVLCNLIGSYWRTILEVMTLINGQLLWLIDSRQVLLNGMQVC